MPHLTPSVTRGGFGGTSIDPMSSKSRYPLHLAKNVLNVSKLQLTRYVGFSMTFRPCLQAAPKSISLLTFALLKVRNGACSQFCLCRQKAPGGCEFALRTLSPRGKPRGREPEFGNRDWSRVRKWDRVGTRELLGPTGTGTVNFHREQKVGSLACDGQNIPPYRHV